MVGYGGCRREILNPADSFRIGQSTDSLSLYYPSVSWGYSVALFEADGFLSWAYLVAFWLTLSPIVYGLSRYAEAARDC